MLSKLRKLSVFILCFCLLSSVLTGYTAQAEESAYQQAIITARIEIWKALSTGTASSATVAIMDEGKIVYSEGFGMRDREKSIPVDTNTQFNIGSISKMFTTTAILLLVDEGKVALDQPVTLYLPEFTMKDVRYKDITVRMLLNHSSGFPGSNYKDGFASVKKQNYVEETLALLAESTLKHQPGEISVYCNDGFTVAGLIIEKVSGMSYADFLEKRIFSKIDMKNSSCYFKDGNSNIALFYDNQKGKAYPAEYVNVLASGGIASTAEDLCQFLQVMYPDKMLKAATLEEFQKPQFAPKSIPAGLPLYQMGLGWDTISVDKFAQQKITVLIKAGGTLEFNSMLYVAPKEKLSVAVIFAGTADAAGVNDQIMQALLEGKGFVKKTELKKTLPLKVISIPEDILSYAGFYGASGEIAKVEFDQENNTLKSYSFKDGEFMPKGVFPYLEDGFFHLDDLSNITFAENYGTKFLMVQSNNSKAGSVNAEKIKEIDGMIEVSAFDDKIWLPRNLTVSDFGAFIAKTGRIKDLPGYIFFNNGSYTAYQLLDKNTAKMSLPYARDLFELKIIDNNGEQLLKAGNYLLSDSTKAGVLGPKDKITIAANGQNEWRLVDKDTVFKSEIPENSRIIVFSSELNSVYGSLNDGVKEVLISPNSYIVFIGNAGVTFEPEINQAP
jgi:CubicO group peptidase (beta-lactamase class C family)